MDKFLVPTGKARAKLKRSKREPKPRLKQTRLTDSPKVVVLEELDRVKENLKTSEDPEVLLSSLQKLSDKLPPVEVLISTKIGSRVKALTSHADTRVSSLASSIVQKWTRHVKRLKSLPVIDVRCGKEANQRRDTARNMIGRALAETDYPGPLREELARTIELEAFLQSGKNVERGYPRLIRTIFKQLKGDADLITSFRSGNITSRDLVKKFLKKTPFS